MNKFILAAAWSILWMVICILLVDYLPSHPHLKYSILLSPFILITILADPLLLIKEGLPEGLRIGLVYWIGIILILIIPSKLIRR